MLITLPEYDVDTAYVSCWMAPIVDIAKEKGLHVLDVRRNKVNRKTIEKYLLKQEPIFVMFNGHGTPDTIQGHKHEPLIVANINDNLFVEKIINSLTCCSGLELGPSSIDKGAITFFGYEGKFRFRTKTNYESTPSKDKESKKFFLPSIVLVNSLLKGHTTKEAFIKSQEEYVKQIQICLTSEQPNTQHVKDLWLNKELQVIHGDKNATIY